MSSLRLCCDQSDGSECELCIEESAPLQSVELAPALPLLLAKLD